MSCRNSPAGSATFPGCRSKLCTGDGSPDCQCAIVGDEYFGARCWELGNTGNPVAPKALISCGFKAETDSIITPGISF